MLQKLKTCLGVIGEFFRIYITDRNSEENKVYRYFDRENYRNFYSLFKDHLLWLLRQKFTRKGRTSKKEFEERKKKLIESNRWVFPDARRSFKLDTIAPKELLASQQGESSKQETLRVDPNEIVTEESIFSLEIDFRALWTSQKQSAEKYFFRGGIILCKRFASYGKTTIAQAPEKGHYSLLPTKDFRKSLQNISTEYQHRILSAISEISANPFFVHGDSVKPLSHQEGLWRKRVGNYRIVYSPIKKENTVILLKVAHRSSVYQDY
jgi:mRNA interferase RelE/StbE